MYNHFSFMVYHKGLFVEHTFYVFIKVCFSGRARQMPRARGGWLALPCVRPQAHDSPLINIIRLLRKRIIQNFRFVPLLMGLVIGVSRACARTQLYKTPILFVSLVCGLIIAGGARIARCAARPPFWRHYILD